MSDATPTAASNDRPTLLLIDGFLKIFKNIDKYTEENSLKGWLRRIMINTALDQFRKNKKYYKDKDIEVAEGISAEENILSGLNYREIIGLIQKLSPGYKTVFNLYAIDGYNHSEIAKMLGISEGTSKSNLAKARLNLQKMLKKNYQDERTKYPC